MSEKKYSILNETTSRITGLENEVDYTLAEILTVVTNEFTTLASYAR